MGIVKFEGLVLDKSFKALIHVCMHVYVWACVHECSRRDQKRGLDLLELQVVLRLLIMVLGTELGSSVRTVTAIDC